jgi:hypothetical protein
MTTARFEVRVPESETIGSYANFLSVWHSQNDFTLDFAVTEQAHQEEDGNISVPCQVVARVRIPVTVADDVLRALAQNVSDYEENVRKIAK